MYNLGTSSGLVTKSPRRLVICPTYNDSVVLNSIAISSLVNDQLPIAVLQTLYDKWWHVDTNNKMMATPQLSELAFTDTEATKSESEWYSRIMQDPNRDVAFVFNDISPRVIKQFAALQTAGTQISFYIITSDDKLVGKIDGTNIVPFQILSGSLSVGMKKISGWSEHAKDTISFRMNEARSLDEMCAITISGGYVTSDDDHWSLIDATCTPSSQTTGGVTLTINQTARDPETGALVPVTGIVFGKVAAKATDGTDNEAPAASENWTETSDGVYVWAETGVFTSGKTYMVEISHSKVDVAPVTFTFE